MTNLEYTPGTGEELESHEKKGERLNNSRPFDVHRWSDYPEAKRVTQHIYDEVLTLDTSGFDRRKFERHLRVMLLDLFNNYLTNPEGYIGIMLGNSNYNVESRYNKLHLSIRNLRRAVDWLHKLEYIELHTGYHDPRTKRGKVTRIRHTEKLKAVFHDYKLSARDAQRDPNRETIILKKSNKDGEELTEGNAERNKNIIEYDDTHKTKSLRAALKGYNELLERSYIDIDIKFEHVAIGQRINLASKQCHRVYNDGSFEKGGRFYGAWWLGVKSNLRRYIIINGEETVELDFRAMFFAILYAMEGLNSNEIGDPYELPQYPKTGNEIQDKLFRSLLKMIFMRLLNNESMASVKQSIAKELRENPQDYPTDHPDTSLLISQLQMRHQPIAHYFGTGMATELMYHESEIAEAILYPFIREKEPILCIHDSYICRASVAERLKERMQKAFMRLAAKDFGQKELRSVRIDGIKGDDRHYYSSKEDDAGGNYQELIIQLFAHSNEQRARQTIWQETGQTTFYEFIGEHLKPKVRQGKKPLKADYPTGVIEDQALDRLMKLSPGKQTIIKKEFGQNRSNEQVIDNMLKFYKGLEQI